MNDGQSSGEASSTSDTAVEPTGYSARKHTQHFRRSANAARLSPDQQRRQAGVMSVGWRALGSRDAMLEFFNTHSDELGGRPLDIAIDSDTGFEAIVTKLGSIDKNAQDKLFLSQS